MYVKPFIALVGGDDTHPPEKYILFYNTNGFLLFKPYEEDMNFIVEGNSLYLPISFTNVKHQKESIIHKIVTVEEMLGFIKEFGIEDTSRKIEWAVSNNDIKNISNIIMKGVKNLYESTW